MNLKSIGKRMKGLGVGDIAPVALVLVVAIITVGIGAMIVGEMNDQVTNANATTVLNAGAEAMVDFSDWFAVIVVVVVAVIILGLVMLLRDYTGGGGRT